MKYREMLKICLEATSCELDQDVTIYDKRMDEFYPVTGHQVVGEQVGDDPGVGILDDGHLYLEIEG